MAYLRQSINGVTVNLYELGNRTVIGRRAKCQITIDDPTVSGTHVEIRKGQKGWWLLDLKSTNGVMVKGKKIDKALLQPGLVFSVGTHEFEFSFEIPSNLDTTLRIKKSWIPGVYYTK